MLRCLAIVFVALALLPASSAARDPTGIYAQRNDSRSYWFRNQLSPKTGGNCCSEADGTTADEDIRDGHYWARWEGSNGWQQVPDDVVLTTPNINGASVVWWGKEGDGPVYIRCYSPGPKL